MLYNENIDYCDLYKKYKICDLFWNDVYRYKLPRTLIPVFKCWLIKKHEHHIDNSFVMMMDNLDIIHISFRNIEIQIVKFGYKTIFSLYHPDIKLEISTQTDDIYHRELIKYYSSRISDLDIVYCILNEINDDVYVRETWVFDAELRIRIDKSKKRE